MALFFFVSNVLAAPHSVKKSASYSKGAMVKGLPDAACLPLSPSTPLATEFALSLDSLEYGSYPFIRYINEGQDASLINVTDEDFLKKAGKVVFRVNRYNVFTNDSLLNLLEKEIIPIVNRDSMQLVRMVLRGAASPEGPYKNNKMLGERRAKMLSDFFRSRLRYPVDEDVYTTEVVIEDYNLLCTMMRSANDPDYFHVQMICNRILGHNRAQQSAVTEKQSDEIKRELMTAKGGRLWKRILKEYFPELRAARMLLFFQKYTPEEPEEVPEVAVMNRQPAVPETASGVPFPQDTVAIPAPAPIFRREMISVKTNLLFYGAYVPGYDRWCPIPNIAVEFYPLHGHFTFGFSLDHPWWQDYWDHKYFQIRNYQFETRFYTRSGDIRRRKPGEGAAFRGFYISAYIHGGRFGICFDENRGWVGEGLGGGLGLGYVVPLGKKGHWRLEFAAQAGYFTCRYDPYQFQNPVNPAYIDDLYYYKWTGKPEDFKKRQYNFSWLGPTRVGINLSWDIIYRKKKITEKYWPAETPATAAEGED
ncbi:MAG: DUF3575 domain-containing protein [Bacteroidaceae bacterium]|nr:DUF3575 domain-containing protein [Bacteroidaceae bacterium]